MAFPAACQHPGGCTSLAVRGGLCSAHSRAKYGTTKEKGYDSEWERLRKYKLARDPFCEARIRCRGMIATQVHHVKTIADRPDLRLEISNLQSVCRPCHRAIHDAMQAAGHVDDPAF